MSERWIGKSVARIEDGRLLTGRGTFIDVTDLQTAIRTYIDSYNERAKPFAWTKTPDELLGKIKRKSINNTRH